MSTHVHAQGDWHGTLRDYVIGFLLSVALTALSFWLVMSGVMDGKISTAWLIMGLAAVQMIVQVRYFLHVSAPFRIGLDDGLPDIHADHRRHHARRLVLGHASPR